MATKEFTEPRTELTTADESGLTLAGFLGFHDPPKRDAHQGIQVCAARYADHAELAASAGGGCQGLQRQSADRS